MNQGRTLAVLQKKLYDFLRDPEKITLYRYSEKDFTRSSSLSFEVVVSSILHLFKESVEFNLQKILPAVAVKPVTSSAFTQARYKIKSELFSDLVKQLDEPYHGANKKLWNGHILLAGDGSTLNLPASEDIEAYFGVHATTNLGVKRYLARTLLIYDVLNQFVVDARLSKMEKGEKTLLLQGLSKIGENAVLTLDRGFGHFCTIKELMSKKKIFCIRLSVSHSNFAKRMMKDERDDFITEWEPTKKEKENSRKNNLDTASIIVRVVKIKLISGETELLVTNLYDQQKYTTQAIGELYGLRWGVEESFKNLKPKMKIEQFGCRKAEGIYQEFYAHIFCMNMVALAGNLANNYIKEKTCHRKLKYKFNWKNAYRFVREKMMKFFFAIEIDELLDSLIEQISCSMIALKPGRSFSRDMLANKSKGRITQYNK